MNRWIIQALKSLIMAEGCILLSILMEREYPAVLFFDPREPMIPAMSAQSISQLDQFARGQSSQRPTSIPIKMPAEQKKPVKASIQVGVRLRQDYIEDLQRMADELYALGEIPEATVPQMI